MKRVKSEVEVAQESFRREMRRLLPREWSAGFDTPQQAKDRFLWATNLELTPETVTAGQDGEHAASKDHRMRCWDAYLLAMNPSFTLLMLENPDIATDLVNGYLGNVYIICNMYFWGNAQGKDKSVLGHERESAMRLSFFADVNTNYGTSPIVGQWMVANFQKSSPERFLDELRLHFRLNPVGAPVEELSITAPEITKLLKIPYLLPILFPQHTS